MEAGWKQGYMRYKSHFLSVVEYYKTRESVKVYLELLLSLLTISVLIIFAIRPTLVRIAEIIKEIDAKEQTLSTMDTKIENVRKAQAIYREQESNIALLKQAIPETPQPELIARQIEALTQANQIETVSFRMENISVLGESSVQAAAAKDDIEPFPEGTLEVDLNTQLDSEYDRLYQYLLGFESLRRPPKIDSIGISSSDEGGENKIILQIESRFPYIKEVVK